MPKSMPSPLPLPRYPGLAVRPVRNGLGIVALKRFRPGDVVCEIRGRIATARTLWLYWDTEPLRAENCFRYDAGRYLDPEGQIGRYANHSCAPNTGIIKREQKLFLVALVTIPRGQEVTHDYSTLLGADDVWRMRCNCGEAGCRGVVRNIRSLSMARRHDYLSAGILPAYILATLPEKIKKKSMETIT